MSRRTSLPWVALRSHHDERRAEVHGKEESVVALDIAEIVWKAMGLEEEKAPASLSGVSEDQGKA